MLTKQISGAIQQIPDTLPRPQTKGEPGMRADVIVIGAGPTGLACAIEAQRAGFKTMAIDKGCIVNSIYNYPANMSFFTTPELLEIGDIPFSTARQKPTREEALEYYRKVTEHYHLDVRQYQWVKTVTGQGRRFSDHRNRHPGANLRLPHPQTDRLYRILRSFQSAQYSGRRSSQSVSLLSRTASFF